ncbi:MAG: response regulator, partial [Candidatus Dadabacteria bacterium]
LCREIVARHGGRLAVAAARGGGSEFSFTVPSVPVYRNAVGQVESARRLRVGLLMKNPVLSDCCVRALRLEEIEARASSHMPGFLALLGQWRPDVVVMDTAFARQLNDGTEERIREAGVSHVLVRCPTGELRELSPPAHTEPLLLLLAERLAPGSHILVVEDDEDYSGVLEFELAQAGYSVSKAANGVEAIDAVVSGSPDAMILDVALPQLDGVGVLEHLDRRGLAIPTVVLTSLDDPVTEDRLRELGVIGIIRKYELIREDGDDAATWVSAVLTPVLAGSGNGSTAPEPASAAY